MNHIYGEWGMGMGNGELVMGNGEWGIGGRASGYVFPGRAREQD
ncbi:hypothetical protein QUA56_33435 [Microcoleus sp. N3A4]